MDYAPEEMSLFLASDKETLSPEALSTLRVMAFLDPQHFHKDIFEGHRLLFKAKNEELMFHFPTTAAAHTEACAELVEASLVQLSEEDEELSMRPEIQTSVLADMHNTGLISPLFNATVKTLTGLWPQMICVPDRTVDPVEFAVATAPGTNYEEYLKTRHSAGQTSHCQEYVKYARVNVWGQRDELVHHIARLEHIFYQSNDDMVEVCATTTFAQLLTEAAWYYFERSRYDNAEVKIQAALGVYGLARGKSSLHQASIHRVHAAIALERGKHDNAAHYVKLQMEELDLPWLQQREALDNVAQYVKLQMEQPELPWLQQRQALKESGLLDRAPDAVALSPWGFDIPPGMFVVLPLRSVCSFGWKLYLDAQNKKEPQYLEYLDQAALCFSTVLKDRIDVCNDSERRNTRIAELLYALGNVANERARFLGQVPRRRAS